MNKKELLKECEKLIDKKLKEKEQGGKKCN